MHPFIKIKEMNQIRLNIFYYLLMNFHFRLNMRNRNNCKVQFLIEIIVPTFLHLIKLLCFLLILLQIFRIYFMVIKGENLIGLFLFYL
jgi:hypothetical protein